MKKYVGTEQMDRQLIVRPAGAIIPAFRSFMFSTDGELILIVDDIMFSTDGKLILIVDDSDDDRNPLRTNKAWQKLWGEQHRRECVAQALTNARSCADIGRYMWPASWLY